MCEPTIVVNDKMLSLMRNQIQLPVSIQLTWLYLGGGTLILEL